jgi:hypothetical protein
MKNNPKATRIKEIKIIDNPSILRRFLLKKHSEELTTVW